VFKCVARIERRDAANVKQSAADTGCVAGAFVLAREPAKVGVATRFIAAEVNANGFLNLHAVNVEGRHAYMKAKKLL
jgi:hypothetical protein